MNAPTLLIGLGGTGSKIIERVSQMVTDEERNNIAFAVFDTDINELREIQTRNPFIKTIQTSTKQTVGEYLNRDTYSRDTWFPVNAILNGKTLTEGAGQVRSISRLALDTVIRAGKMEPLHEAIQSLYKVENDKPDQALRVVIASSLAGGTGSGLILPVAMYVRNYLQTHFRQNANITRGFFILPEVFFEVIKGQTERNNLKANAYATLRELDAFLMKGDDTLPDKYKDSVKIEFPIPTSDGYEEYSVRPYDFCFLFDAQNAEGGKLNSFDQYLDHAANCIYSQSIGPMNKRSNSSEDNTIRKLAQERGRNRYAGAGASMIIYPYQDIRKFIALMWAKQCVSEQWLEFDNRFAEVCKENAQKRAEGIYVAEQNLSSFYINQIESSAKHDAPFAKAIYRASGFYSEGITRTSNSWDVYVSALENKIDRDIEEGSSSTAGKKEEVNSIIQGLADTNDWGDYVNAYYDAVKYRMICEKFADEISQTIAYSMFKGSRNLDMSLDYKLERYLVDMENNFIHPNAIRYVLIKILELLKACLNKEKEEIISLKKGLADAEIKILDDPNTEELDSPEQATDRKVSLLSKMTKRPDSEQDDVRQQLNAYIKQVESYQQSIVKEVVYSQGVTYIDNLIKAFEGFFKSFESKVSAMDRSIDEIYKKYSSSKGTTVRYVCASRECLDKIYEKKPYTGSIISMDPDLSKTIYNKVLDYSLKKDQPNNNRYFSDLFDFGIIGYFEDLVSKLYGNELDVDIIKAIEYEADYIGGFDDRDDAYDEIDAYVRKTINDTRKLACPFIESPMGEQRDPIDACTFNLSLKPEKGDESQKAQLIKKELLDQGGAPDEDIPKNMIMFYSSFYGLRANDLSKFAPPEKSITFNRTSGEYFKAYYELVKGINPEAHKSKEISPHIDRWWHIITKMPDLDEENQKRQEYNIYAAFFWAIVKRYVYLVNVSTGKSIYKLDNMCLKMDQDTLVVSNGTECDKLYEVLDAIAIYPELVEKILADVEAMTEHDVNSNNSVLERGILTVGLNTLEITEPGIGPDLIPGRSIFDIPVLMKKSSTKDNYYEDNVLEMLKVELDEIKRYFSKFFDDKDLIKVVGDIIMEQFDKFLTTMEEEKKLNSNVYKESLFLKTVAIVKMYLADLGLIDMKTDVEFKVSKLK